MAKKKEEQELVPTGPLPNPLQLHGGLTGIVPVNHRGSQRLALPPDAEMSEWFTSYPKGSHAEMAALVNAESRADVSLDKGAGEVTIEVQHIAVVTRAIPNDDGEIRPFSWLVLITPDGQSFGTSSPVVAHRVARLADVFPGFPGKSSVWVRLKWQENKSRTKLYHELRVMVSAPIPPVDEG